MEVSMKIVNFLILFGILFLPLEAISAELRRHVIIPKIGVYKMDNTTTGGHSFDTSSNSVFGFEYERRFTNGLTIGAEHMHFKNTITDNSSAGELKVDIAFFTSKYYFNYTASSSWLPYVGVGVGYAFGSTDTQTSIDGAAYQIFTGIAYEWNRVGMYVQYKQLDSTIETSYRYFGSFGAPYDISGKGFNAGVIIKF